MSESDTSAESTIDTKPDDRRHDDRERARMSEELRSTMELIMAFEDQFQFGNGNATLETKEYNHMSDTKGGWRDVSSYSRDDKERVPHSWSLKLGSTGLIVHRIHRLEGWYATSPPFCNQKQLKSTEPEQARVEALEFVFKELTLARDAALRAWEESK